MRALVTVALAACGGASSTGPRPLATCPDGEVVLTSQDEVDAFPACPLLAGLTIRSGVDLDLTASGLQHLRAVDGDLVIGPSIVLGSVELRELATVRGTVRVVGNGGLVTLVLPRLTRAGAISIAADVELRALSMPVLAEVDRDVVIDRTHELAVVDLAALETIGGELAILDAPSLTAFEAASLVRAMRVRVERTGLDPERIAALQAVSSEGSAPPR
jgi:hypothetical protein